MTETCVLLWFWDDDYVTYCIVVIMHSCISEIGKTSVYSMASNLFGGIVVLVERPEVSLKSIWWGSSVQVRDQKPWKKSVTYLWYPQKLGTTCIWDGDSGIALYFHNELFDCVWVWFKTLLYLLVLSCFVEFQCYHLLDVFSPHVYYCGVCALREYRQSSTR